MTPLSDFVDERFLTHRLRSTSIAGIIAAMLSILLSGYRYYMDHVISWDLISVGLTFIVVKYSAMAFYRMKD
ncbi:MAG TPA: hypothetical protein VNC11_01350 [Gemmatimonadaceae bacterium]|jgi:hypothetical protein|nr:hypothetical protein [Gemmatimonadaceae bacterium]